MTEKLYDVNAYLTEFDAAVVSCQVLKESTERDVNGQLAVGEAARPDAPLWEVVLDRTAFYPEGGGQPCDFGVLGGARVTDVQEKDGIIFHLCSAPLEVGSCVHGTIDWDRRLMHMREHSGEHIISGIICHTHGYSNIGFHMGKDCVTIDFSGPLTAEQIQEAEDLANRKVLENIESLDRSVFNVQCNSCDEFISEEDEYCPCCGDKLPEEIFKERGLTDLAVFCEEAIEAMGINPVLARVGYEGWKFYKGSSEIRMFVYDRSYLFATSPLNILPKKNLEPVLTYLLQTEIAPYRFGLDGNQIYLSYRVHISDIFSDYSENVKTNLTHLAFKADDLDNYLVDTFGCEFSEYANKNAI